MPTASDNIHVRAQTVKTDDSGKQQMIQQTARKNERYGGTRGIPHIQTYGRTAHVPTGSIGMVVTPDGNPDKAMGLGYEHPDHRPTGLNEGEIKDYDMWGSYMHMKSDGWHFVIGASEIHVLRDGTITLKGVKVITDTTDKTYLGGADADKPLGMLGSTDNDSEINGPDALVGNLSTKAVTK